MKSETTSPRRRFRTRLQLTRLAERLRRHRGAENWFGVRRSAGLAMLAALVALRIWDPVPLEALRLRGFDFLQMMHPRDAGFRPAVVVDIDESALRRYGQWPWPRTLVADLVTRLRQLGAVGIGLDIIFAEPDRLSPARAAEAFRNVDEDTKARLRNLPDNDSVLADAIRGAPVVLGQSGILLPAGADTAMPQSGIAVVGPDPSRFLVTYPGFLRNVPALEQAAGGRGLLTIRNDRDGIVRRLPLVVKAEGIVAPALAVDMLRTVTRAGAILVRTDDAGIKSVAVPGLEIPTDRNGQFWIRFGPHDKSRYVSAGDVLDGRVPPQRLAGKLALVGTSAVGLLDIKTTPMDAAMPGVEIHAQVLEAILSKSILARPYWAVVAELAAAIAIGFFIVVLAPMLGAGMLLLLGFAAAIALAAASWLAFLHYGLLIDASFPVTSSMLLLGTLISIGYIREQKDRQRIRSAFSQYLSPALVEQLAQSPDRLVLGGEERTMSIMFSDVRGFTAISESYKNDPQGLTQLMNRFLTPLTNAIIAQKGTIDKYMGDAIMAFWNAPIDDPDHEINACRAALDMLRCVDALNVGREAEARAAGQTYIPILMGIGINTGRCVVGNMGSDLRFDYSVLGDPVNLASRLEGRSKSYGTPIVIGALTAARAGSGFALLELDLIRVKGKSEPERIFTVLGSEEMLHAESYRRLAEANARMLSCYRRRDWDGASQALQACRSLPASSGLDEFYDLYAARVQSFREVPPPADWDGVFDAETK